jgi:hypothetical protein
MTQDMREGTLNKALAGCIIALLTWNVYTTSKLSIDVAVLSEKVGALETQIKDK